MSLFSPTPTPPRPTLEEIKIMTASWENPTNKLVIPLTGREMKLLHELAKRFNLTPINLAREFIMVMVAQKTKEKICG